MNENIYNNDIVLKNLRKEKKRGELTLFFGALAGVGKTYTMLKNAIELLNNGTNIVIGYVEKHGREETEQLIDGLPIIPLKQIEYRKKIFYELDLDAIIEAKPDIVLIDELAHTNVYGSRHQKRYQDVLEILDNGIDVFCTMNVQHVESLNDMIFQITGVKVKETVPDSVLERVDKIQIIDIPPEKLINRLNEGKIYKLKSIEKALMNFFRLGNINALREIALKEVTKRVSKDVYNLYEDKQINSLESVDKIMVCIDSSDFSAKLIRHTKRLASQMNAPWIALYIENFSNSNIEKISKNIRLAEELGAEVNTISGENTYDEVLKYARERFVTHIVIAKKKKNIFSRLFKQDIPNEIISKNSEFCIILYSNNNETTQESLKLDSKKRSESTSPVALFIGIGLLLFISIICIVFRSYFELLNIALLLLIPVLIVSSYGDIKKSIIVVLLSIGIFNYFFIPPLFTFTVSDIAYIWSFFIFFIVAYLISTQSKKLKLIGDITREREKSVRRLFKLSRRVSAATEIKQVIKISMPLIAETLKQESLFFINKANTKELELYAYYDPNSVWYSKKHDNMFEDINSITLNQNEKAVLNWCYENKKVAGFGTDTFGALNILFVPIINKNILFGIFAFKVSNKTIHSIDTKMFLESVINLISISFERIYLFEQNKINSINLAKEELKDILLSSISHDLRTPLSSILGMILVLKNNNKLDKKMEELTSQIIFSIKKMERLLNNLLDSARFDSANIVLKEDWHDISDIFYTTTNEFKDILKDRRLEIKIEDLGIFKTDFVLIERVLVNLLENAIKYSHKDSKILMGFKKDNNYNIIYVQNEDSHIEDGNLSLIFERFFRIKGIDGDINGNGIGLFICKKIVELFGGYIEAKNIENGVNISFYLPDKE